MAVSKVDVGCCELTYKLQTFSETPSTSYNAQHPYFFPEGPATAAEAGAIGIS